jgi:hypothetical protein
MRSARILILAAAALSFALAARPQEAGREAKSAPGARPVDRLGAEIEQRIAGKVGADDVRIEVSWRRPSEIVSARVYGDGVGVWRERTQFTLTRQQVLDLLRALRDARFGAMEKAYGGEDEEAGEEKPKEKVYLRGSVAVRIGTEVKRVAQYMEGSQSEPLAGLARRILAVSEKAAKTGTGAASLSDGLAKLMAGKLAPQTLQILVQSTAGRPGEGQETGGWILRIEGLRVLDRAAGAQDKAVPPRLLVLSHEDFHELVELLRDSDPQGLPRNLFSTLHLRLDIRLLAGRADLSARRYAGKTAETLGAKQAAFDRLYAGLAALHERAGKQGAVVPEGAE